MTDNQEIRTEGQVDEIELIDFIDVLCRWKKTIILGTLSCMLIAGVGSYFFPKVYRISTVLEIGTIEISDGTLSEIESPVALMEKIKGKIYDEKIREVIQVDEKDFPGIKIQNPKNTALIKISIESSNRKQSVKILKAMSDIILKEHLSIINIKKIKLDNRIQEKENKIKLIKQDKVNLQQQLKLITKSKDQLKNQIEGEASRIAELERAKESINKKANPDNALSLLLFSNEIQENRRYYNQLQDKLNIGLEKNELGLKNKINQNDNLLKSVNLEIEKFKEQLKAIKDTKIIKKARFPEVPIRPMKMLNVMLSGGIGLAIFIFLAFFMEYIRGMRKPKLREVNDEQK